jgi:hypothetical protein
MDESKQWTLDVNVHRRILEFLNAARRPEDLMVPPPNEVLLVDARVMDADEILHHDEIRESQEPKARRETEVLLDRALAKRVLEARDDYNALHGFRHITQLERIAGLNKAILDKLIWLFSPRFRGKWETLYDAD